MKEEEEKNEDRRGGAEGEHFLKEQARGLRIRGEENNTRKIRDNDDRWKLRGRVLDTGNLTLEMIDVQRRRPFDLE